MKLFYSPGACSLGIHVLLEEIGASYELALVNLREGQQFSPEFRAVNPKGKVPALVIGEGRVLTEFPAIAFWLAMSFPQARLIAQDVETQARTLELIDYIVATVHMRGYTLTRLPQKFADTPEAQARVRKAGLDVVTEGLTNLAALLGEKDWFVGDFSIADAAAFYLLNWAASQPEEIPGNLIAFHRRMLARPAVARALQQEGLAP